MTGRKSLLFGVHQFLWHPITVWLAWRRLYGWPSWKETFCIFIHDWGYWRCKHMDDAIGQRHPEVGARIAGKLFGDKYRDLVLYHSRHYALMMGKEPSKLCWADKLSIIYDPMWFYLFRARLSGELKEYRQTASKWVPLSEPDRDWYIYLRNAMQRLADEKKGDAVPYSNQISS